MSDNTNSIENYNIKKNDIEYIITFTYSYSSIEIKISSKKPFHQ